jgi:flavorubredoxin
MARYIAEGLKASGVDVNVANATDIQKEQDLLGYDGYVFGSATYHGQMMPAMKTVLFLAANLGLEGKIGASFGAFGWSGEAPDRIYETMRHILRLDMVHNPLSLKSLLSEGAREKAHEYGRAIGRKLVGTIVE